ncbi:hypothetical protein TanjilG_25722 [Lupinus angustifolius]|uniref:S1 motif domain-containing protein n=1 Tax=Lupinus angustifolius TaxID=3871 RepID=A0A1J7H4J8_LUPAN|nr:PREDICTED: uncharacterized protein LOC109360737 [Lupinus angustifolius]OIW01426.1 hypothetical protein TanjilG_25722 [Lupinus angustifolius]
MQLILCSCNCKSLCFPNCTLPLNRIPVFNNTFKNKLNRKQNSFTFTNKDAILSGAHVAFCSRNDKFNGFSSTQLSQQIIEDRIHEHEAFELLNKPSLVPIENGLMEGASEMEDLAPFEKNLTGSNRSLEEVKINGRVLEVSEERDKSEEAKRVKVEYYEPKPGDFVVGVVVSGNEDKLNVNVGAELLGTMLTKEVLPLDSKEMEYLLCDMNKAEENFKVRGRMEILKNDDATSGAPVVGSTVVDIRTILFAEVIGRTLAGRPLLSSRRLFRRIAWQRLRQIKQLNEPIEVRITGWNTGGLLTRIEGLRAFLPKTELMKRVNSFTELKENVGRCMHVQISQVDEAKRNLIISEREAWERLYLQEGTLLEGTVKKILPYGAQIRIGETNRSGLLHVSNISRAGITSISDVLFVDEKVKVLVVKSMLPDKISLSIADLESEPGLFLSNKEKVFLEADIKAKEYKEKLPPAYMTQQSESEPLLTSDIPFENEALYANWKWFKFEK